MTRAQKFYPFNPHQICAAGTAVICTSAAAMGIGMFMNLRNISFLPALQINELSSESPPLFSLGLRPASDSFAVPRISPELSFSSIPPYPTAIEKNPSIYLFWRSAAFGQALSLPCRIDLEYTKGQGVKPSCNTSLFWMDLTQKEEGAIEASIFIQTESGAIFETERFCAPLQSPPLHKTPFAEEKHPNNLKSCLGIKWLGRDRFAERYTGEERFLLFLEPSGKEPPCLLHPGAWIVHREGRWEPGDFCENAACARILYAEEKRLIWEGWDAQKRYCRFLLEPEPSLPQRIKGEEILSGARLRSEKQIGCFLDKQYVLLRQGDWALNISGRWRVLRTPEDKNAYREGKYKGLLFVFDGIQTKSGQKYLEGTFFNEQRTEAVSLTAVLGDRPR